MATRYICDRCGREIKNVMYRVDIFIHRDDLEKSITTKRDRIMDLCENCYGIFTDSLKKELKK